MTAPEVSIVIPCHNEEQNLRPLFSAIHAAMGESVIVFRRDPVGILAYLPNSIIYIRNLMLIRQRKFAFTAAASSQVPRGTGLRRTASSASAHVDAIAPSS